MLRRMAALSALAIVAACANVEFAGRNAQQSAPQPQRPAPVVAQSAQPTVVAQPVQRPAPVVTPAPAPSVAAASLAATPPPVVQAQPRPAPPTAPTILAQAETPPSPAVRLERPPANPGDIVVPGQVDRQVPPPSGDPRTVVERMTDIRNWDRCVTRAQFAGEADPLRPQLEVPEQLCARELGMANRTAVPDFRRR